MLLFQVMTKNLLMIGTNDLSHSIEVEVLHDHTHLHDLLALVSIHQKDLYHLWKENAHLVLEMKGLVAQEMINSIPEEVQCVPHHHHLMTECRVQEEIVLPVLVEIDHIVQEEIATAQDEISHQAQEESDLEVHMSGDPGHLIYTMIGAEEAGVHPIIGLDAAHLAMAYHHPEVHLVIGHHLLLNGIDIEEDIQNVVLLQGGLQHHHHPLLTTGTEDIRHHHLCQVGIDVLFIAISILLLRLIMFMMPFFC